MRNEYLVDKLVKLNVTKCPYFEYSNNPDYFGDCYYTQGYYDLQKCQYKQNRKVRGRDEQKTIFEIFIRIYGNCF